MPSARTVLGDVPYLLRELRPRLAAELGDAVAEKFFVRNPARAFSWA